MSLFPIIRNHEMLNQVQHDNGGELSVTLNLFQGLTDTDTCVFDYGLWSSQSTFLIYAFSNFLGSEDIKKYLPEGFLLMVL
jgi:hypothetical protein